MFKLRKKGKYPWEKNKEYGIRYCERCSIEFTANSANHIYCNNCKSRRNITDMYPVNNVTIGAASEIAASYDLMLKGYDVFRALSPSSMCDLVAIKNNKAIKVEVRSGTYLANGDVTYIKSNRADVVMVVSYPDKQIRYYPEGIINQP